MKVSSGWSDMDVAAAMADQLRSTTPKKRESALDLPQAPENLKRMYRDHELGELQMLWTYFWDTPRELSEGWGFADMSETNIVLTPSGRVEAYNAHPIQALHGDSHFLGALAISLECFLEAMLFGQMSKTHFVPGFPDEDSLLHEKTVLIAKHCSLIAGGYEYYDFWAGILGLPPMEGIPL